MKVECLFSKEKKLILNINKDNYYCLPLSVRIEISEINNNNVYINGQLSDYLYNHLTGKLTIPYRGENILIECGQDKCKIFALKH